MTAREMWVHAIKGGDELGATAYTITQEDDGVALVEVYEKAHTPESWTDLSAEIARALRSCAGRVLSGRGSDGMYAGRDARLPQGAPMR